VVVVDGDDKGVERRLNELAGACQTENIAPRQNDDRVVIAVPTWNIETWLAYLSGSDVDESRPDYPRLGRQRDCQPHVDRLTEMCRQGALRPPAPLSLEAACAEYRSRLQP
jgi:hypothetical protein